VRVVREAFAEDENAPLGHGVTLETTRCAEHAARLLGQ
jgi:hypothetical protein